MGDDDRQPVLVGVGTAGHPGLDLDRISLATGAINGAFADAGGVGVAGATTLILTAKGSWSGDDIGGAAARAAGVPERATSVVAQLGIAQTAILARACEAILSGEHDSVVVLGVENRARAQRAARSGVEAPEARAGRDPDELWRPSDIPVSLLEIDARLIEAVYQYAMIENAVRHHDGLTLDAHAAEVAALWSRFDEIAATNPEAWFAGARTAGGIAAASPGNRPLAFPYNKWHSTQWTIDQSTALLLMSVGAARAAGVAPDRWVFPLAGADHDCVVPLTERAEPWRCPGAGQVTRAALGLADLDLDDVDLVDLYSCFPVAVGLQAREIGLDPEHQDLTVTGGMAFAGGPFNHYTLWSTAVMARRLRAEPGRVGLVTAVSGMLTKQGAMVWSSEPGDGYWHADVTGAVEAATPRVPCVAAIDGPGRVVTYTALPDDTGWAIVDLADGRRTLARLDAETARRSRRDELCGARVVVGHGTASRSVRD